MPVASQGFIVEKQERRQGEGVRMKVDARPWRLLQRSSIVVPVILSGLAGMNVRAAVHRVIPMPFAGGTVDPHVS